MHVCTHMHTQMHLHMYACTHTYSPLFTAIPEVTSAHKCRPMRTILLSWKEVVVEATVWVRRRRRRKSRRSRKMS